MVKPKIYADFHNADSHGRLRLNCVGTVEDLAQHNLQLREGMLLTLYSDDLDDKRQLDELLIDGVVSFSQEEHCWVAAIDWSAIRHASEVRVPPANGDAPASSAPASEAGRTHVWNRLSTGAPRTGTENSDPSSCPRSD